LRREASTSENEDRKREEYSESLRHHFQQRRTGRGHFFDEAELRFWSSFLSSCFSPRTT
jgi:hypothetical protein